MLGLVGKEYLDESLLRNEDLKEQENNLNYCVGWISVTKVIKLMIIRDIQ